MSHTTNSIPVTTINELELLGMHTQPHLQISDKSTNPPKSITINESFFNHNTAAVYFLSINLH